MMWLKSLRVLSWIASLGLVGSALFIAYIILFPVDVIKNWKLELPAKNDYTLGETVVLESTYQKTTATNNDSQSERYIECINEKGVSLRYLLNKAVANRKPSNSTGTGVVVQIPNELSGIKLPTTCFFSIAISYNVYPRQAEPEYNRTRDFTLHEEAKTTLNPSMLVPLTSPVAQNDFRFGKLPEGSDIEPMPTTAAGALEPLASEPEPSNPTIIDRIRNFLGGLLP